MVSERQILFNFQTRVRQLILRFNELKKENEELYAMLEKSEDEIAELQKQLEEKNRDYESLKAGRVISVAQGDVEATKSRLSQLARDVNKCIAILTDEK